MFAQTGIASEVKGFRVWADPEKTRAVIDLGGPTEYRLFTLSNPDRVVLDIKQGKSADELKLPENAASGAIAGLRYGQLDADTLRVVFDLASAVDPRSFLLPPTGEYGHRLVVDLLGQQVKDAERLVRTMASLQSDAEGGARDLIIAIDAGHGGEDPGAIGKSRTREKDVVLQIARRVATLVDQEPGMRAVMVRNGDYYIPLRERYENARAQRADLFVSIHADAFTNREVRGSSVFVLSQRGASSEFARIVADTQNAADLVGGVSLGDKDDLLASVLLDLSQSATIQASDRVAADILQSLRATGPVHKPIVGRANFMVLKSPDVPSVLVETAFISNPAEEQRLKQQEFQQDMATAITRGIRNYFHTSAPPGTWIAANRGASTRHVVSSGETLGIIANRYKVSLNSLKQANNMNTDLVRVGAELRIPAS